MKKRLKEIAPLLAAIVVLMLIFRTQVRDFLNTDNLLDLTQQISINAILAFGMTLVILTGGIDLSVGALVAVVGTTTAYFLTTGATCLGLLLALPAGIAVAVIFGLVNGTCAAKTKMPPFIITLATMLIARGAALRFNQGRPMSIPDSHTLFLALGNGRLFGKVPVPVLIMLVVFVAMTVLLHRTRFGLHLYAVGGNREAARFTGINVARIDISVYVICSILAAIAGLIHASQLYSGEPASGSMFELSAIAAAIIGGTSFTGGRGTMYGTLLGAVIIGILGKGLNQSGIHHSIQHIAKGLVILVAVYIDCRRSK